MDFFEAQDRARRRTNRLVVLFVFAVLGIIAVGYVAAMAATNYGNQPDSRSRHSRAQYADYASPVPIQYWNPHVLTGVTISTVLIVGLASLYKWATMRQGGAAIAESVGARQVDPKTTDLRERRLLNVVEEMAIASGIPVPAVYILDQEPGLNAFAAGLTTSDAAVCVTKGTMEKLTRDELQGVIAHEFSHILNGDMRLNVRITAVVFGILVIGLLGRMALRGMLSGRSSGGGKDKGSGILVAFAIGLALMIIGYVGYFFGRLIQAAVSRQREFLADASAVQFTRNPAGITGALKKIGGYALGSSMQAAGAEQLGHFFFAQGFRSMFGGLWATHPPLEERIRAVDPSWDGKVFEPPEAVDISTETFATAGFGGGQRYSPDETLQRVQEAAPDLPPPKPVASVPFKPAAVVADVGALTDAHFRSAQSLLAAIPGRLREAARDTAPAQALVYGLLLSGDKAARDQQQQLVVKHAGADAAAALVGLRPALSVLDPEARLPLLQLALPALRSLDGAALDRFATTLDELVHADGRVTPFEYALQKMLLNQLRLAQTPNQRVQYNSFPDVADGISIVLSALARAGGDDAAANSAAFASGATQLPMIADRLTFLDAGASSLEHVDTALDKLALASLPIKKRLLVAAGHVIGNDGTITAEEGELYRALSATLGVPMPNLSAA